MYSGKRYLSLALALGSIGALAACGGGGDGSAGDQETSVRPLTKAQFVKKANAICRKGQKEVGRLNVAAWKKYGPPSNNPTQTQLNNVALAMLPPKETEVRLIRALGAPKGDEAYIDKMLTAWEEGIERGKENPAGLQGGAVEWVFQKSFEMGMDYGLSDCWLG